MVNSNRLMQRKINTPSINPMLKNISREQWLERLKSASESQKINNSIVAQNIDSRNGVFEQNTKVYAPIIKSMSTLFKSPQTTTNQSDNNDNNANVTSNFHISLELSKLLEEYVKKLSEHSNNNLKIVLSEIEKTMTERDQIIKHYESLNDDSTEKLIQLKDKIDKTNDKFDELLIRLDENNLDKERLEDLREMHQNYKTETEQVINSLKTEITELQEQLAKTLKDFTVEELKDYIETLDDDNLVLFLQNNLPKIRAENKMTSNEYNNVYKTNRHMKASSSLKKDIQSVKNAIIQYKSDQSTTGQGYDRLTTCSDKHKNLELVNLLLASNKAGNTSGFKEFEQKLNKLLDNKMISKDDYECFIKSWRIK